MRQSNLPGIEKLEKITVDQLAPKVFESFNTAVIEIPKKHIVTIRSTIRRESPEESKSSKEMVAEFTDKPSQS